MSACTCCMCLNTFEGEEPPILMMDRAGNARVLCPDCAAIVDAIAGTPDSPERDAAVATLREMDIKNPTVAFELAKLIDRTDTPLTEEDGYEDAEELEGEQFLVRAAGDRITVAASNERAQKGKADQYCHQLQK